jgi:DNA-directed RNA polymerase subunit M/transcription elongation factor TFIIS
MTPKKKSDKLFFKCNNCGLIEFIDSKNSLVVKDKIKPPKIKGKGVIENENIFATYDHKCKKCGYDKAQVLDLGIFYSDEDNLILLKCGKCGYSERIGRKTS